MVEVEDCHAEQIASAEQENRLLNGKIRGVICSMNDFQKTKQDLNFDAPYKDENYIEDLEGTYAEKLHQYRILDKISVQEVEQYESHLRVLERQLDERELKSVQASDALKKFQRALAVKAIDSKTGKSIPDGMIDSWLAKEEHQQEMLELERLKKFMLQRLVRRAEKAFHYDGISEDDKSCGLYSLDFDYLQADTLRLRGTLGRLKRQVSDATRKRQEAVHRNAHFSKKLEDIQDDTLHLNDDIKEVRARLEAACKARSNLQTEREKMKKQTSRISSRMSIKSKAKLVANHEENKKKLHSAKDQLVCFKEKYTIITVNTKKLSEQINQIYYQKSKEELPTRAKQETYGPVGPNID